MSTTQQRDLILDYVKGLLIVLVALGHAIPYTYGTGFLDKGEFWNNLLYQMIYSFHMPLFMLLSGYFFYHSAQRDARKALSSRLRSIGIPLVSFTFLLQGPFWAKRLLDIHSFLDLVHYIAWFLTTLRDSLWFLGALLLNCILVVLLLRIGKRTFGQISLMLMLWGLLLVLPDGGLFPITYKYVYPYFILGFWLSHLHQSPTALTHRNGIWVLCLGLWGVGMYFFDKNAFIYNSAVQVWQNGTLNWSLLGENVYRWIMGCLGSLTFLGLSSRLFEILPIGKNLVIEWGKTSLGLYGFQVFLFAIIFHILPWLHWNCTLYIPIAILLTTIILSLCMALIRICQRWPLTNKLFLGAK